MRNLKQQPSTKLQQQLDWLLHFQFFHCQQLHIRSKEHQSVHSPQVRQSPMNMQESFVEGCAAGERDGGAREGTGREGFWCFSSKSKLLSLALFFRVTNLSFNDQRNVCHKILAAVLKYLIYQHTHTHTHTPCVLLFSSGMLNVLVMDPLTASWVDLLHPEEFVSGANDDADGPSFLQFPSISAQLSS